MGPLASVRVLDIGTMIAAPFGASLLDDDGSVIAPITASGTRAADMAVRLHYDDVPTTTVQPDLDDAVSRAIDAAPDGGQVQIFATYTAMWALHDRLRDAADAGART